MSTKENVCIIEPRVSIKPDFGLPAYSVVDANSRYETLGEILSQNELKQLIQNDEQEAITAHIAETTGLGVMPYSLTMINNDIGSAQTVEGDNGNKITIFRSIVNMLKSSVEKNPNSNRAKATLRSYQEKIFSTLKNLNDNDAVLFFSPPDWGGRHEYGYGFAYVLQAQVTSETKKYLGIAFKIDFSKEEYLEVYKHFHNNKDISRQKTLSFEDQTGNAVFSIKPTTENSATEEALQQLLSITRKNDDGTFTIFGQSINSISDYVNKNIAEYYQIKSRMILQTSEFIQALQQNDVGQAEKELSKIQQRALEISDPHLLMNALIEAEIYGESRIPLPCGYIYLFGSGMDKINLSLMGIVDPENDIWICEDCGHVHFIDAKNGILFSNCQQCGRSGRC